MTSIAQDILPTTNNGINIGSSAKNIDNLHANNIAINSGTITGTPTNANDIVNKNYVDSNSGGTFSSDILPATTNSNDLGSTTKKFVEVHTSSVKGLSSPVSGTDAASKSYVDGVVSGGGNIVSFVNGYTGNVSLTADVVEEGIFNQYYTDAKVDARITSAGTITQSDIDTAVANLVDSAPATLNTLNELAAALGDDANFSTTITNQIAAKADTTSLATVATSGAYSDLTGAPTITTALSTVTLSQQGTLAVTTGTARWYAPANISFSKVTARIATAATGSTVIVVNVNGVSEKTLTITSGNTSVSDTTSFNMTESQYLTIDLTNVGTTPGTNLNVQFIYTYN